MFGAGLQQLVVTYDVMVRPILSSLHTCCSRTACFTPRSVIKNKLRFKLKSACLQCLNKYMFLSACVLTIINNLAPCKLT